MRLTELSRTAPPSWRRHALRHAVYRRSAGTSLIKGAVSDAQETNHLPAYSASGQDVWVPSEFAIFDGSGLVLSAVGARCGKVFFASGRWGVVANTQVFLPRPGFDARYLWYVFNLEGAWVKGGSAQPYVQVPSSLAQIWAFPDRNAQRVISAILDRKTALIDGLIAKKERLIELLQEKRQALITQAVTKGLDQNVPMKDSGIEWLGDVPEDWMVLPARRLSELTTV